MNKGFNLLFQSVSVIRLMGIPLIFILEKLWKDSIPDAGLPNFDLHFPFWAYLVVYGSLVIFSVNTIGALFMSFNPQNITGILKKINVWRFLYFSELVMLPFLVYISIQQVQETFFPPKPGIVGEVLDIFWPSQYNSSTDIYQKLQATNYSLLACCSIFFVIFFWKRYKEVSSSVLPLS